VLGSSDWIPKGEGTAEMPGRLACDAILKAKQITYIKEASPKPFGYRIGTKISTME
jgi:hypothetical protein